MAEEKLAIGMVPVYPREFILVEILEELTLSIAKAAKILGVRAATLSDLVNEKSSLSPEMAMRIELAFDVKAQPLPRVQALYHSVTKLPARERAGRRAV